MEQEVYNNLIEDLIEAVKIKDYVEIRKLLIRISIYNNEQLRGYNLCH